MLSKRIYLRTKDGIILDRMVEIAEMADRKDSENKKFNWKLIGTAAAVVISSIGIGAIILGRNVSIKPPNET